MNSLPSSKSKPVLVSACLLGCNCRYNGVVRRNDALSDQEPASEQWIPVCPEEAGGLPTPRPAAQIVANEDSSSRAFSSLEGESTRVSGEDVLAGRARVVDDQGNDVTAAFIAGAEEALRKAQACGAQRAYLKSRSPSCGCGELSTGSGVRPGNGVTTALLMRHGIHVEPWEFSPQDRSSSASGEATP